MSARGDSSAFEAGARLKVLRLEKGMRPEDLADQAGLSPRTIRNIEAGKQQNPTEFTKIYLAQALDVPFEEIWGLPRVSAPEPTSKPASAPVPVSAQESPSEPLPDLRPGSSTKNDQPARMGGFRLAMAPLLAGFVGAAIVMSMTLLLALGRGVPTLPTLAIEEENLVARDPGTGKLLWRYDADAPVSFYKRTPWQEEMVLIGLGLSADDGGRVCLLNLQNGKLIWTRSIEINHVIEAFGEESVSGAGFMATGAHFPDLDGDGVEEIAVDFMHGRWYPHCLLFLDGEGRILGQYDHRGHLYDAVVDDLDRDGREEILYTATNNARKYQSGSVIKFDRDHLSGASLDGVVGDSSRLPDNAAVRVVFGPFGQAFLDCMQKPRLQARGISTFQTVEGETRVAVNVSSDVGGLVVTLDRDLNPLSVNPNDYFDIEFSPCMHHLTGPSGLTLNEWLALWLESAQRFEGGHWPQVQP